MSDQEQNTLMSRSMTVAACAVAATMVMPLMVDSANTKQAEFAERLQADVFARNSDGAEVVRADIHSPRVLETPWLRNVEYTLKRDPSSLLSRYTNRDRDGLALSSLSSFRTVHLSTADQMMKDLECLNQAVYYEAGNESREGQLAVAEVIMNRVKSRHYPNSVCEVVYQGSTRTTGCQFTFTCDGALKREPDPQSFERAGVVAAHVLLNMNEDKTAGATHYHANYVDPIWNSGLVKTRKIGAHIFYRFPRGSEWASANERLSKRQQARVASYVEESPVHTEETPVIIAADDTIDLNAHQLQVITQSPAP